MTVFRHAHCSPLASDAFSDGLPCDFCAVRRVIAAAAVVFVASLIDSGHAGRMYAMATVTKTITINAAFLKEIKEDNTDLRRQLNRTRRVAQRRAKLHSGRANWSRCWESCAINSLCTLRWKKLTAISRTRSTRHPGSIVRPKRSGTSIAICFWSSVIWKTKRSDCCITKRHPKCCGAIARDFHDFHERFFDHESRENDLIVLSVNEELGDGD